MNYSEYLHYNPRVETAELKILLALEPSWTVSINSREFVPLRSSEVELTGSVIRFGQYRRIIEEIRWLRPNVVQLRTRTRLRTPRDVVTFYPGTTLPSTVGIQRRRREFQKQILPVLQDHFRSRHVTGETLYSDKAHGIGLAYPRMVVGGEPVIAVEPDEPTPVVDGIMRAAILWAARIGRHVTVVVPAHRRGTLVVRLEAMPALRGRLRWLQWNGKSLEPLETATDTETYVHPYRKPNVDAEVQRLCAQAPGMLQPVPNIAAEAVSLRFRGLEVARISERGTTFPLGEPLESVVEKLAAERRHGSRHPIARAYEERWLESNLIGRIGHVLPVRPHEVYPQVPSFAAEDRSVIDLLAMTDQGRLVVIELKVSADPDLPFQAFDYWLAVERHRKAGDFERCGYFPGMPIRDEPAVLVLVAPLLAFHRTTDVLIDLLPTTLPLMQIGINQAWKKEIKILRRKGLLG